MSGGLGHSVISGVSLLSYPVSCVNLSMLALILSLSLAFSRFLFSLWAWAPGPCLRTTWPDDFLLSPVHLVVLLLQFQRFCLRLWNPDLFTGHATLSWTYCFRLSLSLPHLLSLTLNGWLWKAHWHLLLRCWPVAPFTTTVIIIIWPSWSSMNVWTSWPCSVIISNRYSQKRTGYPSEPGSSRFLPF